MKIKDVKTFDQQLSLIFHAVLAGPILLYVITYLRTLDGTVEPTVQEVPLAVKAGVAFFSGILLLAAFVFYNKEIRKARALASLREKLSRLFQASIINYAMLEMAQFIAVVAFFLTHEHLFTGVYLLILLMMSLNRPTADKYVKDLHLTGEEKELVVYKRSLES